MLQPDTYLNHYRILRPLGEGGMGEVYEAEDTRLKRRVALKVLPHDTASDAALRARFEREAQTVASLNHPNIVTIHSVEECRTTRDSSRWRSSRAARLTGCSRRQGLPLPSLLKYAIPIVDAVAAAHARDIVHRDLKPANVMVTGDGRVKVLDFGVAKLMDRAPADAASVPTVTGAPATFVGQIVGTAAYMSPEQAEGRPVDHRSDIFSIGVLLYEMATGVRPFRGDDQPLDPLRDHQGRASADDAAQARCVTRSRAHRQPVPREGSREAAAIRRGPSRPDRHL